MKYFVTTAIDYTNAAPHIGHAYEKILADVIVRYRRTQEPAFLLIGVDQHGQKVQQAAQKEGIAPAEFANRVTDLFLALWEKLNIRRDGWAATTDPRHRRAVQKVLQALHDKGELYKAKYSGYYSVRQEQFLTDRERNADGEFGAEWGEVILLEEENWYFCLAKHKEWLLNFVRNRPGFVIPAFRHAELLNAIDRLSGDLCVSRPKERLSWGIEFPFDPGYVTYVWFDALLNYVTFAGYEADLGSGLPNFADLWPCQAHIIGKDIMVPAHGIYWPIMLHAMGFPDDQMPRLAVHGWWNIEGAKMSKSLGNVVDPARLVERFGADAVRYYLMRDIATGHDADFSVERLLVRYHSELANGFGNLVNRTINMVQRYRSGRIRKTGSGDSDIEALKASAVAALGRYKEAFDQFLPHAALEAANDLVTQANGLVELKAPWKLAKDPAQSDLLDDVLFYLTETSRFVASLMAPIIPSAAEKILQQLNATVYNRLAWGELPDQHQLATPSPVFPRFEE
ncbi:MAG: methionine--tRNA ligase [Verrucomicrobia bacterium]|nr:methionine--tRNA ligase [Verrucomicrobiota bacterium]